MQSFLRVLLTIVAYEIGPRVLPRTAKADEVFPKQPADIVAQIDSVRVPAARARSLRVDVHWDQRIHSIAARDQRRRCSRNLREGRNRIPLPPVAQPAQVDVVRKIRCEVGGQAGNQETGLARDVGEDSGNAASVAGDHSADVRLTQNTCLLGEVPIAASPMEARAEAMVQAQQTEVVADGKFAKG